MVLWGLLVGCTQLTRQTQNTQQNTPQSKEAPAQTKGQSSVPKSERGKPAEAKAMLQQAVDHYNSVGRKQALADFTGKKPPFVDRDLYVACIGPDHTISPTVAS